MFVLSNLLIALAGLVHAVFQIAWWVLIARIVLSWIRPDPRNSFVRTVIHAITQLTDPVLDRARRAMPFLQVGGFDLSPIAVFLLLGFADTFITRSLYAAAAMT